MQAVNRYCIDCVYSTLVFPDKGPHFYQCGNPEYVQIDLVDGSKTLSWCADVRRSMCGSEGRGYLSKVVSLPLPNSPPAFDPGVALISAPHPRPSWWKRFLFWVRYLFGGYRLSEDSLETIEIEIRDP